MTRATHPRSGRDWGPFLVGMGSIVLVAVLIALLIVVAKPGDKPGGSSAPNPAASTSV